MARAGIGLLALLMATGCAPTRRAPLMLPEAEASRTPAPSHEVTALPVGETPRELAPTTPAAPVTGDTGRDEVPADNAVRSWYYVRNDEHAVPRVPTDVRELLERYGGIYVGPDPRSVYLTFDEGYENGNTSRILDVLKRNGVRATFFVTKSYIDANPELVRRMVAEGHVVGNHSATHPSMPSLAGDSSAFAAELERTAAAFESVTGQPMARLFRPPRGEYSARSLYRTQALGYTTVFWSFAHRDWVVDDQPSVEVTVSRILAGSHPGAIYLLHAVSTANTAALDEAIRGLKAQGYRFGTL